ncbi:MAG: putative kinase, aminoglycoside phosphotransferase family [Frankiales bacterium]|nr:putative kinase, aminoglycoside phosphotransferase family [Frankiales bacterium]
MAEPGQAVRLPGVDAERVSAWVLDSVAGLDPPLSFSFISGGRSNLTYRVDDAAGRSLVLRRPPMGNVLATAHDMSREWRVMSALQGTAVPVPATLAICQDHAVTGADFYLMGHVDGHVVATVADAEVLSGPARQAAGFDLVRVMALLHDVEPDAVGLTGFGRRESYLERQLYRWQRQLDASRSRDLPAVDELSTRLSAALPAQQRTGIVHGDFRLGNVIVDGAGQLLAVLDWELCTLGDPLADLGWLLSSWTEPGDSVSSTVSPSMAGGFPTAAELAAAYAASSGLDLSDLEYYIAFAHWRSICISEGVYSRYRAGVMGDDDFPVTEFGDQIIARAQYALDRLRTREDPAAARRRRIP